MKPSNEELGELLAPPKGCFWSWGALALLGLVVLLLVSSFFIRYADKITAPVDVQAGAVVVPVIVNQVATVNRLLFPSGSSVRVGDPIMALQMPLPYAEVLPLFKWMDENRSILRDGGSLSAVPQPPFVRHSSLGQQVNTFHALLHAWKQAISRKGAQQNAAWLAEQKTQLGKSVETLRARQKKQQEVVDLTRLRTERDSILVSQEALSPAEAEYNRQRWRQAEMDAQQLELELIENERLLSTLKQEQSQLSFGLVQWETEQKERLLGAWQQLESERTNWENGGLVRAPLTGNIRWNSTTIPGQTYPAGTTVGAVSAAADTQHLSIIVKVPIAGSGKVKVGQSVHLELAAYPKRSFGHLRGTITSITSTAETTGDGHTYYPAAVVLENGLTTNRNQMLTLEGKHHGTATIITAKKSLWRRFLNAAQDFTEEI